MSDGQHEIAMRELAEAMPTAASVETSLDKAMRSIDTVSAALANARIALLALQRALRDICATVECEDCRGSGFADQRHDRPCEHCDGGRRLAFNRKCMAAIAREALGDDEP